MKVIVSNYSENFDHATILIGERDLFLTTNFMEAQGLLIDAAVRSGHEVKALFGDDSVFITYIDLPYEKIVNQLEAMPFVTHLPRFVSAE